MVINRTIITVNAAKKTERGSLENCLASVMYAFLDLDRHRHQSGPVAFFYELAPCLRSPIHWSGETSTPGLFQEGRQVLLA